MPYDPTIDPPDVANALHRTEEKDPPEECVCGGDLWTDPEAEVFAAHCDTCGAEVVSYFTDDYDWAIPPKAIVVLAARLARAWPHVADRPELLEHLKLNAEHAEKEARAAGKAVTP